MRQKHPHVEHDALESRLLGLAGDVGPMPREFARAVTARGQHQRRSTWIAWGSGVAAVLVLAGTAWLLREPMVPQKPGRVLPAGSVSVLRHADPDRIDRQPGAPAERWRGDSLADLMGG